MTIDATYCWGVNELSTYEYHVTIHTQVHQVLLYYGGSMVENRKVRYLLNGIKFGPMDAVKATVVAD